MTLKKKRLALALILLMGIAFYSCVLVIEKSTKIVTLIFTTNSAPPYFAVHAGGGGVSARYGKYVWKDIKGCYPYYLMVEGTDNIAFINMGNPAQEPLPYTLIIINTNNNTVMESEHFGGAVAGPCPESYATRARFEKCGLRYEEYLGYITNNFCLGIGMKK
jgi:hypothetical protein